MAKNSFCTLPAVVTSQHGIELQDTDCSIRNGTASIGMESAASQCPSVSICSCAFHYKVLWSDICPAQLGYHSNNYALDVMKSLLTLLGKGHREESVEGLIGCSHALPSAQSIHPAPKT